jgi:hypothetical protein
MKTSRSSTGLSILAGGLTFVGSVGATDLIVNGSFEDDVGVGWVGHFGIYNYSANYWLGPPVPASENPGSRWSWQHGVALGNYTGPCIQTVPLTSAASDTDIDAGRGQFTFSAWLASYGNGAGAPNPERPYVTVQFLDATGTTPIGGLTVLDRTSAVNFRQFADGTTTFDRTTHEHHWAKYVNVGPIPQGARSAKVGITRNPTAGVSGAPDTYVDLVKLDVQTVAFIPPAVTSQSPLGGDNRPDAVVRIGIQDGTSQLDANSLKFSFDGVLVNPNVTKVGAVTTVVYDPPGLLPGSSTHTVRLVFNDNRPTPFVVSNQFNFTILSYYNILLPPAIHLETFDTTDEGSLPTGWSEQHFSATPDPTIDFNDLHSAAYTTWTVVNSSRFNNPLLTYAAHDPTDDYKRVLSTNLANVVNGAIVDQLAQGRIAFGNSGYRDGNLSQIMYLFSKDFDLSGQANVYLSFHSLWEQNQDSIGAVEYSIDEGVTWQPVAYYLDAVDVVRDGDGNIDAAATLSTAHNDVATYIDPGTQQTRGGLYGAFIGVESNRWNTLSQFISPRVDDNPVESKRVEIFRLPLADNQPKVRLRFAHAGADSWYFGLDNVGLYSIATVGPPTIVGPTPSSLEDAVGNTATFSVSQLGLGPFTYQWQRNGVNISGQINQSLSLSNIQLSTSGNFSVVVGYPGGSVTSAPAPLTVFIGSPAPVVGQWDFRNELIATCGPDLDYFSIPVLAATIFAESDLLGLPDIGGSPTSVMNFPGLIEGLPSGGYKLIHGLSANGGGSNVNQYTLIMDVYYPASSHNVRRALLQTDPSNLDDAEFRFDESNRLGVSGIYQGRIEADTWTRVALAVDLAGPGPHPVVAKFINGVKVGQQVLPGGVDSRWSLPTRVDGPWALLFGGAQNEVAPGYVSSVQLRKGRLNDAAIAAMGAPTAGKIPGAACVSLQAGKVIVHWSGSRLLQADSPSGTWSSADEDAKTPYETTGPLAAQKFYRSE